MKSFLKFSFTLFPFLLFSGYVVFKDNLPTYTKNNALVPETIIPAGWYPHAFGTSTVLFTRSRFIPKIEGTEGYAYGEQIVVSISPYDGEPKKEEDWYQLEWINEDDEYGHPIKEWFTLYGYKILRLEYDGMTSGGDLSYFVFTGNTVHVISLYPAYNSPHLEAFEAFFEKYVKALSPQWVLDYSG